MPKRIDVVLRKVAKMNDHCWEGSLNGEVIISVPLNKSLVSLFAEMADELSKLECQSYLRGWVVGRGLGVIVWGRIHERRRLGTFLEGVSLVWYSNDS